MRYNTVRLILGDQLNASHTWFKQKDDSVLYVIAELKQETDYAKHHIQKVLAFFAAMKGFAHGLEQAGHKVWYLTLDESTEFTDLTELLKRVISHTQAQHFEYIQPDEYRLSEQLKGVSANSRCVDSEHYFLPFDELANYGQAGKHQRMEFFYRKLRKRFSILMAGDKPIGDKWNFDADNRQKLNDKAIAQLPQPLLFSNDISDIKARIERHGVKTIGEASDNLLWPINRKQSLELLSFFCQELLPNFGRYQDAMINNQGGFDDASWSLYHSRLSFSLNAKMLSPKVVVDAAINEYLQRPDEISIAQVEGFVRQILGWREFVRLVYWLNMPEYASLNHLEATRPLPSWFWTADTKMNCLHHAIAQSLKYSYAHHIQRLMVTGNFCLIAGIDPSEVDEWYLGIYVDAIEWVEMPNTRGMSQFADGGIVGSKAYAASGNYINKMSNYCKGCQYDVNQKVGPGACPLNSLYWHFMVQHESKFKANPRNSMVYRNWLKQSDEQREAVLKQAEQYLIDIENI